MNEAIVPTGLGTGGAIEPGDLVRVIRSHCPAAWEEEQGTYLVVIAIAPDVRSGMVLTCHCCGTQYHAPPYAHYGESPRGLRMLHPAAWLRKVPGLTAGEVAEFLSDVLDETPEHAPLRDSQPEAAS